MERKIDIIYEDDSILVLDKPSGLVVNRSHTNKTVTLQDILEESSPGIVENEDTEEDDFIQRTGIVHRLDKDTSGLLIVAKNRDTFNKMLSQFKERKTQKEYLGILCGKIDDPIIEINAPIKRNPKSPLRYAVVEGGKEAFTRFENVKNIQKEEYWYTLMKILPKTGRTHQIRVHSLAIGNPIAGDQIYCSKILLERSLIHFGRMMLHASKIGIFHPKTDKFIEFTSKIPKEFSL